MPEVFGKQPGYPDPRVRAGVGIVPGPEPVFAGVQPGESIPTLLGYIRKRDRDGDTMLSGEDSPVGSFQFTTSGFGNGAFGEEGFGL